MKNRIEWRGWINPYVKDEDKEFVAEDEAEKIFAGARFDDGYGESEDESPKDYRIAIPSPNGAVPITIFHNFADYQFWRGDTNFIIDDEIEEILNSTLGVERLTVYSPYIFIIGIGRLFDSADVKVSIQKRFDAMPAVKGVSNPAELTLDKDTSDKVELLKSQMNTKYWAIVVFPNGEMEPLMTDIEDDYANSMKTFTDAQEVTGAIIFTNPT